MIDVNSNCSRVDAVKAQATLLKLQTSGTSSSRPAASANDPSRKVKSDLQSLDTQIKANNAQKAEIALAATKKDISAAQTASYQKNGGQSYQGLDVYA
jgi:hypothetical protein